MKTNDIREKFLNFFKSKGHTVIPSAPVVPEHDPTVLFTTAGMHPLVPYLLGEPHPGGRRLANSQKCVRTVDIDEVGDNRHLTMFEMLGNWSLGDYYKEESIRWSFEFLTDQLGIDPKKLYVTVYEGDPLVPKDQESIDIWRAVFDGAGIKAEEGGRLLAMGRSDNWWEQGGVETGPAGPDTEIFYYLGTEENPEFDPEDGHRFIEIWNNVFMAYQRQKDGSYVELKNKNVDTGMGLERIAAVLQGVDTVFETDLFKLVQQAVIHHAGTTFDQVYKESDHSLGRAVRIVTDHLRSSVFMAADGVRPSNTEQGYVMRRLIRRAVRQGLVLGVRHDLGEAVAPTIISLYKDAYPELELERHIILDTLSNEEIGFRQTLERGVREFEKLVDKQLTGETVFLLFDTYGFPPELSVEEAKQLNIAVADNWREEFDRLMEEQRQRSRTAAKGQFKGGLADHSEMSTKYHTATHLLYRALREVLGAHVVQRGSNITEERLRFDFSHPDKMTDEEIRAVEDWVNDKIEKDLSVSWEELPTDEAMAKGAYGAFGDKYGDTVKVYSMRDDQGEAYSFEICGGPHVESTGLLAENHKRFKIQKEQSSSAGVRRIKAVLE